MQTCFFVHVFRVKFQHAQNSVSSFVSSIYHSNAYFTIFTHVLAFQSIKKTAYLRDLT